MMNNGIGNFCKKWLSSLDRVLLFTTLSIISIGIWISIASTPAVAMKLGLPPFHFVIRHVIIIPFTLFIMLLISLFQMKHIRKLSVYGYFICILLITGTLFWGAEIKGAKRWLSLFGFSFQPSELLKPIITVITAWLISEQYQDRKFPGILISIISILLVIPLLLLQPDIGILIVIVGTWFAQLFISGLSVFMIIVFLLLGISSMFALYFSLPHFANRIDRFITKSGDEVDFYQIKKSIEAFRNGGFGGKGPGEGVIKTLVPDSHSDFVFSIIGEEFGFVMCIIIICLFSILIVRTILRIMRFSNMFNLSVGFGILFQITLQVLINICTSLNLIPTKGTTLPFISYGGSSMLASAISFGIIFAITKKNALQKY